jgi:hypothetical protein
MRSPARDVSHFTSPATTAVAMTIQNTFIIATI